MEKRMSLILVCMVCQLYERGLICLCYVVILLMSETIHKTNDSAALQRRSIMSKTNWENIVDGKELKSIKSRRAKTYKEQKERASTLQELIGGLKPKITKTRNTLR